MLFPLILLLLQAAAPVKPAGNPGPFAPLAVYGGVWSVKAEHSFSGGTGPDRLENRCTAHMAFYTCEQVVNGRPSALLVFTLSKEPGKFDVDTILPNGHASSNTDLYIRGEHWTFLSHAEKPGDAVFRVENTFRGTDEIHFEIFRSADDGKTWAKVNEGDDLRIKE